jgi:hypothetical protein
VSFELSPHFEWITSFRLIHHIVTASADKQSFSIVLLVILIVTASASPQCNVQERFSPLPVGFLNLSWSFILLFGGSNNTCFLVSNCKAEVEKKNPLRYKVDKEEMSSLVKDRYPLFWQLLKIWEMRHDSILIELRFPPNVNVNSDWQRNKSHNAWNNQSHYNENEEITLLFIIWTKILL